MATTYNTLSLERKETRKSRSVAPYVALGLVVVALAGAGSYVASSHTNSVIDGAFDNYNADVVNCWANAGDDEATQKSFEQTMPRYDPDFSDKADGDKAFYNACYYSYSCCTEVKLDCLASEGYGQKCRSCLQNNGPRMVIPLCSEFLQTFGKGAALAPAGQDWGKQQILEDSGFPTKFGSDRDAKKLKRKFEAKENAGVTSCWKRVGDADDRMGTYVKNCWDAISWCNLLCPRDDDNTVDEKMCKECVDLGFQENAPKRFTGAHTFNTAATKAELEREVIRSASNKQQ